MILDELYRNYNQQLSCNNFKEAERCIEQILQVSGQPWQQYVYMPAVFYESWGDYISASEQEALAYYNKALQYRYEIGTYATGSGEGLEAMYHIKRIQKKIKSLSE